MSIKDTSTIAANFAQVITLFVLIFGYFYTVVPVFQKEKLSEEVANLKLEKNEWNEKVNDYQNLIDIKVDEISLLKKKENSLSLSLETLSEEHNNAAKQLGSLNDKIKNTESQLKEAEEKLYQELKAQLLGTKPLGDEFLIIFNRASSWFIFEKENKDQVSDKIVKDKIDPVIFAQEKLEKLKKEISKSDNQFSNKISSRLVIEFEHGIKQNKRLLQCNHIDAEAWQRSFTGAFDIVDDMLNYCADFHFAKQAKDQDWDEKEIEQLKKSDFWEKQKAIYKRNCSISVNSEIEQYFNNKWRQITDPCQDRLIKLSKIVFGLVDESDLSALQDTSPPTNFELKGAVTERINNWYGEPDEAHNKSKQQDK